MKKREKTKDKFLLEAMKEGGKTKKVPEERILRKLKIKTNPCEKLCISPESPQE